MSASPVSSCRPTVPRRPKRNLLRRLPGAEPGMAPPPVAEAVAAADALFRGRERGFCGPEARSRRQDAFFQQIYAATRRVGWGRTTTYGALAKELGAARRSPATSGQAMARNPVPLIIPCHRYWPPAARSALFGTGRLGFQGPHAGAGGRSPRPATTGTALRSTRSPGSGQGGRADRKEMVDALGLEPRTR